MENGIDLDQVRECAYGEAPGRARRVVRTDDIIVATVRPSLRGFAIVPAALHGEVASTGFAVLRARSSLVLPHYIWSVVRTDAFAEGLMRRATGSNYPAVRPEDVAAQPILLPALAEQRRIVDLIGALDGADAACRRVAAASDGAYGALLHEVFRVAHASSPTEELGVVAATRLGKMLDAQRLSGVALPYLANVDVRWDEVRTDALKTVPLTDRERQELSLVEGDVLVCEGGEAGRTAVLARGLPGIYFQKAIHRVRCGPRLRPRFFMHFMRYATSNGRLADFLSAVTIQHLTGEKLRRIPVPLPAIEQQDLIVGRLDATTALAKSAIAASEASRRARSALLTVLLSAEHEIPASYDRFLEAPAA